MHWKKCRIWESHYREIFAILTKIYHLDGYFCLFLTFDFKFKCSNGKCCIFSSLAFHYQAQLPSRRVSWERSTSPQHYSAPAPDETMSPWSLLLSESRLSAAGRDGPVAPWIIRNRWIKKLLYCLFLTIMQFLWAYEIAYQPNFYRLNCCFWK